VAAVAALTCLALLGRVPEADGSKTSWTTPQQVAEAYGAAAFGRLEKLTYTFNVERDGQKVVSRTWTWEPAKEQVRYWGPGKDGAPVELNYVRTAFEGTDVEHVRAIDQSFINDSYWLLFPMHLVWDENVQISTDGLHPLPIPPGDGEKLTVRYTGDAGYTPGDVYELYLGPDRRIVQWVFRKGGTGDPRPMTWEQHQQLGPIVVATEHRSPDGKFRLWFSDVSAVVDGQEVRPQPLVGAAPVATPSAPD
jgi:hypothetical protein